MKTAPVGKLTGLFFEPPTTIRREDASRCDHEEP